MFLKMHLIRSACGRHDSKTFASHAARASQGIIPSHSTSVAYPRAPREPSAAPSSRDPVGSRPCLESRYQAFIASRNRITLVCLELRLVQSPHATTIIIAFAVAIRDAGWPTPDCPWSMLVRRSQKKYFRNFNFNFNYRELLSKSVLLACVVAALCRALPWAPLARTNSAR